jgi:hypothetical protein
MPQTFPNAYAYQSPIGQGLNNIARMLLADDGGAKAAVMAAQGQAAQAHAAKYRADAEQTAQQTRRVQDFLPNFASNLVGADGPQALRYYQGATETIPAYEDEAKQMTMAPTVARVQRPASLDDAKLQMLSRAALLAAAPSGGAGVSMENLAQGIERLGKTQAYDGVLSGAVDPSRYMIASEKPLYHFGETYAGNVVTGEQKQNALGQAKVGTERAHQGAYGAQANASNARARESDRGTLLVEIPNPLDPTTKIKVPASTLYTQTEANKRNADSITGRKDVAELRNADGSQQKIIKASQADRNAIGNALTTLLAPDGDFPIDASDPAMAALMEKALASYSTPGNPGYLNDRAAARMAVESLSATGTTDGNWSPSKNRTKLSIVPQSQRVENQSSSSPAPASSNPVVDQARAAVAAGADPAKVRARLQQNGINPALAGL